MKKKLHRFLVLVLGLLLFGCGNQEEKKTMITFKIPDATSRSFSQSQNYPSSHLREEKISNIPKLWELPTPSKAGSFNCYGILITYPEEAGASQCYNRLGNLLARPSIGIAKISSGSIITANVKIGGMRTFHLIGMYSTLGNCPGLKDNFKSLGENLSNPVILGKTTQNITANTSNVAITASRNGAEIISRCIGSLISFQDDIDCNNHLSETSHSAIGLGTSANPYLLCTAAQIKSIGDNSVDWDKHYELRANVDLSAYTGANLNPIGNSTTTFTGSFNGNHFAINNYTHVLSASVGNPYYCGFFGKINGATVQDLKFVDANVSCDNTSGSANVYGGVAFGHISGSSIIKGVSTMGSLFLNHTSNATYGGGFAGLISDAAIITRSKAFVNVATGPASGTIIGGFIGGAIPGSTAIISDSYSLGNVTNSSTTLGKSGGFLGLSIAAAPMTIARCYSKGVVSSSGTSPSNAGFIVNLDSSTVTDSFFDSTLAGQSDSFATAKTTLEMKINSTFSAWDSNYIWILKAGNYPKLSTEF